jgi:ABC-type maltose transport system permease subunit
MAYCDKTFPAVAVVMVPIVLLFVITSRLMIEGLTAVAIKQ